MAPINTMMPKSPGIRFFLIILAPYATEKEGPTPLPPMLIAKNMAIIYGINRWLNIGDGVMYSFYSRNL